MRLFLVEAYMLGSKMERGWDIEFFWLYSDSVKEARKRMAMVEGFDTIIQIGEHTEISDIGCDATIVPAPAFMQNRS